MIQIYVVKGPDGKRYFGQTTQSLKKRWTDHRDSANAGVHYRICEAIRKQGWENFTIEALGHGSKETVDFYEKFLIAEFKTTDPEFGYNMAPGGTGGDWDACHTPAARERMRKSLSELRGPKSPSWNHNLPIEEIKTLYASGMSTIEIGKKFGVCKTTIQRRLGMRMAHLSKYDGKPIESAQV